MFPVRGRWRASADPTHHHEKKTFAVYAIDFYGEVDGKPWKGDRNKIENLSAAIPYFDERMRGVKPGITGFAQVSLGYTGRPPPDSPILAFRDILTNPFKVDEAEGALADDMRIKLLYDLAYGATLQSLWDFLRMELYILWRTPLVMVRGVGR